MQGYLFFEKEDTKSIRIDILKIVYNLNLGLESIHLLSNA